MGERGKSDGKKETILKNGEDVTETEDASSNDIKKEKCAAASKDESVRLETEKVVGRRKAEIGKLKKCTIDSHEFATPNSRKNLIIQ